MGVGAADQYLDFSSKNILARLSWVCIGAAIIWSHSTFSNQERGVFFWGGGGVVTRGGGGVGARREGGGCV